MEVSAAAWLAANSSKFNASDLVMIRQKLEIMSSDKIVVLSSVELKDPMVGLLLCLFLGGFGVHRFWLRQIGMGVLELLTGGLCGILTLIDLFTIMGNTRKYNLAAIMPFL